MMMNQTGGGNQPARAFGLALVFAAALLGGCAHTRPKPQVVIDPSGDIRQYKRYERHVERDWFRHFVRKAYFSAAEYDFDFVEGSQRTILDEWGRPDYVRKPFSSLNGELIEEWVYTDRQRIFQFLNRETVFEGPLTDYEQLLLRLGRPSEYEFSISETGIVRCVMIYSNVVLTGRQESYNLADDWIVYSSEGR